MTRRSDWHDWWKRRGADELSLLLWSVWNPITFGVPLDEFTSYVPRVGRLLREGGDEATVDAELRRIRTESLGPDGAWPGDREAAALIVEWHAHASPG